MRAWSLLIPFWFIHGCATLSDRELVSVPAVLHAYFAQCAPSDGAVSLAFFRDGTLIGSGDAEWVARDSQFTLEMLDPVGRLLLKLQRSSGSLAASGPLTRKIPAVQLRRDGFLDFNGRMVPIRLSELPCILAGKLPHSWLRLARRIEEQTITAADPHRTIAIQFEKPIRSASKICTRITWGGFAWFEHKLTWCQQGERVRESYIDGDGVFGVRIVKAEEEAL